MTASPTASPATSSTVPRRPLGSTGFDIAPLAFGGNVFGWSVDKTTSFRLLDTFVDAGFNLVDTADVYSVWAAGHRGGESESIIGEWFAANPAKRERVLIATKCGMELAPDKTGLSRRWIRQACDDSLKRLRTDRIDLYQAHKDDPLTPLEETLGAFDELVKEGKVRAIGASNYSAQRLAQALEVSSRLGLARFATLQPEYNLMEREGFERDLQPLCAKEGIAVINYFGLARGFLTGKYRSEPDLAKSATRGGGVKKYLNERGLRVLAALDAAAKDLDTTPAQVALAWNMAQPTIAAPIASATSVAQLEELMGAARVVLDEAALALLNAQSSC